MWMQPYKTISSNQTRGKTFVLLMDPRQGALLILAVYPEHAKTSFIVPLSMSSIYTVTYMIYTANS